MLQELSLEAFDTAMDTIIPGAQIMHMRYDAVAKIMNKSEEDTLVWLRKYATPLEYEGWWEIKIKN